MVTRDVLRTFKPSIVAVNHKVMLREAVVKFNHCIKIFRVYFAVMSTDFVVFLIFFLFFLFLVINIL